MTAKTYAKTLYTAYCEAVGGRAYNGQPLPTAEEFWNDPAKTAQAKAWEAVAEKAMKDQQLETEEARETCLQELLEEHIAVHGTELLEKKFPQLKKTGLSKVIGGAAAGAILTGLAALAGMLSSCSTAVKQTSPDGTVTERAFSMDPKFATRAMELWGVPHIPSVNVTK